MNTLTDQRERILFEFVNQNGNELMDTLSALREARGLDVLVCVLFGSDKRVQVTYVDMEHVFRLFRLKTYRGELEGLIQHVIKCRSMVGWGHALPVVSLFAESLKIKSDGISFEMFVGMKLPMVQVGNN